MKDISMKEAIKIKEAKMNSDDFLIQKIEEWSDLFNLDYPRPITAIPLPIERVGLEMKAFLDGIRVGNLLIKNHPIILALPPEMNISQHLRNTVKDRYK